ncbi:hypothetical protein T492DRAFT_856370, partial [Pavlovales sp. CCMP2436]
AASLATLVAAAAGRTAAAYALGRLAGARQEGEVAGCRADTAQRHAHRSQAEWALGALGAAAVRRRAARARSQRGRGVAARRMAVTAGAFAQFASGGAARHLAAVAAAALRGAGRARALRRLHATAALGTLGTAACKRARHAARASGLHEWRHRHAARASLRTAALAASSVFTARVAFGRWRERRQERRAGARAGRAAVSLVQRVRGASCAAELRRALNRWHAATRLGGPGARLTRHLALRCASSAWVSHAVGLRAATRLRARANGLVGARARGALTATAATWLRATRTARAGARCTRDAAAALGVSRAARALARWAAAALFGAAARGARGLPGRRALRDAFSALRHGRRAAAAEQRRRVLARGAALRGGWRALCSKLGAGAFGDARGGRARALLAAPTAAGGKRHSGLRRLSLSARAHRQRTAAVKSDRRYAEAIARSRGCQLAWRAWAARAGRNDEAAQDTVRRSDVYAALVRWRLRARASVLASTRLGVAAPRGALNALSAALACWRNTPRLAYAASNATRRAEANAIRRWCDVTVQAATRRVLRATAGRLRTVLAFRTLLAIGAPSRGCVSATPLPPPLPPLRAPASRKRRHCAQAATLPCVGCA